MAGRATRDPRYIPPPEPVIGIQLDMLGGRSITHVVRRKPVRQTWGADLLRYHLADHFGDLPEGSEQ